jgi:phosphoribosylanthranilate isomerase
MPIEAKICGVRTREAAVAAARGGARWIGFVFYPKSPRALTPLEALALAESVPPALGTVGLFVDPGDDLLEETLRQVPLDMIQLHGKEPPRRVAEIRTRFDRPVMKAVRVAGPEDVKLADAYLDVADRLLFDSKPPKAMKNALPGGNAISFDWRILAGRSWTKPWMLSGGLGPDNVGEAVGITGATAVDVSSGVESQPGVKAPDKITAFLDAARRL